LCAKYNLCFHEPPYKEGAYLLIDGRAVMPDYPKHYQQAIIKGDGRSAAIAAASVVAKHYRDTAIIELAKDFPGYDWENNMGYATPLHLKGIRELGITVHHRKNFKRVHEQLLLPLDALD
jgi:ribonuclease HII